MSAIIRTPYEITRTVLSVGRVHREKLTEHLRDIRNWVEATDVPVNDIHTRFRLIEGGFGPIYEWTTDILTGPPVEADTDVWPLPGGLQLEYADRYQGTL